jgi:hypothetical protein
MTGYSLIAVRTRGQDDLFLPSRAESNVLGPLRRQQFIDYLPYFYSSDLMTVFTGIAIAFH